MSARNDGGPAFPVFPPENHAKVATGMSLRDHFAGLAMQGIVAGNHPITRDNAPEHAVARAAYVFADAMLTARESSP